MSEAVDIELEIYQKIWALMEDYIQWSEKVPEGNRIRYDNIEATLEDPIKPESSDADYPQAVLRPGSATNAMFTSDESFGTHAPDPADRPTSWIEDDTYEFVLTLTTQKLSLKGIDTLAPTTRTALRRGGPKLGDLPYVVGWRLRSETRETDRDDANGTMRFVTTMRIVVQTQRNGGQDLGE